MFERYKASLTMRQAVVTVLVAVALSLFTSGVRLAVDLSDERDRIREAMATYVALVDDSAARAAYELDPVMSQRVVSGLLAAPSACRAALYNDFGEQLAEAVLAREADWTKSLAWLAFKANPELVRDIYSPIREAPVGRLELELDRLALFSDYVGRTGRGALIGLARNCLLALILAFFFHRAVIRPVLAMSRQVSGVDPSNPISNTIEPPPGHKTDELGKLAQAVNRLIDGLGASLEQARRTQAELDRRQAHLKTLTDNVPDGVLTVGPEGVVGHANPAAGAVLGLDPGKLAGRNVRDMFGLPGLPSGERHAMHQISYGRGGSARELEVRITRTGFEGEGFDIYLIRDITEQKRLHQALAESEDLFRSIVEQAPDALYIIEREGTVIQANRQALEMLGHTNEELVGKSILELDVDFEPWELPRYWTLVEQEGMVVRESSHRRKDGSLVPVESRLTLFERGGRKLFMARVTNVAERRAFEQALKNALDQAEAASLAKSEFLANMSHEVRTPLNGAMGMLHILLRTTLDETQRQFAETALKSCRNLVRLLSDILDLSKVEAGRLEIIAEPVNVADIMRATVDNFADIALDKGLDLACRVDPAIPKNLMGDPVRLRQVLFNLTGNAVKYTDNGRVVVEAWGLSPLRKGHARVLFVVSDTGQGIPDDKVDLMFEAFTQLDSSFDRRYQGAGLGLRIVKRLMDLMGGTLAVDSTLGKGTSIYFTLPLSLSETERLAPAQAPTAIKDRNFRVLIVEDESISCLAVKLLLNEAGFTADTAANGEEALVKLGSRSYDIVLMDVQMPVMDGVEATRRLRASEGPNAGVPIIALTAYAMKGDRQRFMDAGMTGYVVKPIEDHALMEEIQRVLADSGFETAGKTG